MATWIVGTLVLGTFAGVGAYTMGQKKNGGGCCGGCQGCAN